MNKKRSKICFFNCTKFWGGGEKWHHDMAIALAEKGHNILVIARHDSQLSKRIKKFDNIDLREIHVHRNSFINPFKRRRIKRILAEEDVQSIIINASSDLKLAGPAAKAANVPDIIYRRGSAIPISDHIFNRWLFGKFVDRIIANSQKTAQTIVQNNPDLFPTKSIEVIHNGIDISRYEAHCDALYQKCGDELIIGNAGRMVEQKGQKYLIEIAKELRKSGLQFKILIAGDGPLRKQISKQIAENGLNEYFVLLGFVENMPAFMQSLDIFVLTSLWEGFGYVLAEAMASELPILAFDISSNSELVKDTENGFLIEPFNTKKMANGILEIANDKDLYLRFSTKSKFIVAKSFDIANAAMKLENFLLK